jgi:hypothetical protein
MELCVDRTILTQSGAVTAVSEVIDAELVATSGACAITVNSGQEAFYKFLGDQLFIEQILGAAPDEPDTVPDGHARANDRSVSLRLEAELLPADAAGRARAPTRDHSMHRMRILLSLLTLIVIGSLMTLQNASAEPVSTAKASLYYYSSSKPTACSTGGLPNARGGGLVVFTRAGNVVSFDVRFQGEPNATYAVALACGSPVGQITTDNSGTGFGSFQQTVKGDQTDFFVAIRSVTPPPTHLASSLANLPNPVIPPLK